MKSIYFRQSKEGRIKTMSRLYEHYLGLSREGKIDFCKAFISELEEKGEPEYRIKFYRDEIKRLETDPDYLSLY